jgi:hypothetical protein
MLRQMKENTAGRNASKPEPPYFWQSQKAFTLIAKSDKPRSEKGLGVQIYSALCFLHNIMEPQAKAQGLRMGCFEAGMSIISKWSCVGPSTAKKGVRLLEEMGVISVERRKGESAAHNLPSLYTILSMAQDRKKKERTPLGLEKLRSMAVKKRQSLCSKAEHVQTIIDDMLANHGFDSREAALKQIEDLCNETA